MTITIGSVQTLPPGAPATITNTGTAKDAILNISIPAGHIGPSGAMGMSGTPGPPMTVQDFVAGGGLDLLRLTLKAQELGLLPPVGEEKDDRAREIEDFIQTGKLTKESQLVSLASGAPMDWVMSFDGVAL